MARPTAIVFGGSRGIGKASVAALAGEGFDVAFTYASHPETDVEFPDAHIAGYKADIRDASAVAAVFEAVERDFSGPLGAVVLSAGIGLPNRSVGQTEADAFRAIIEVNLIGAFNVLRESAARVSDGGSIIALTTSYVRHAPPGFGPYCATKAAVESLVRAMSKELGERGIRVNAVAPGPTDTALFRAGKSEAAIAASAALSPFKRVGQPEEIANAIAFLASPKASWINGQILQPNGGLI